ncbi:hypothetical protein PMAYCL1PPCAC_26092, partial [Pristionchus mayeri]
MDSIEEVVTWVNSEEEEIEEFPPPLNPPPLQGGRGGYQNGHKGYGSHQNGYGGNQGRGYGTLPMNNNAAWQGGQRGNNGFGAQGTPGYQNVSAVESKNEGEEQMCEEDTMETRTVPDEDDYFFIKRRELVNGKLNGEPVRVLLDTRADVSIISRNVIERIKGVKMETGSIPIISDVQNSTIDILGKTILDVELEVGKRSPVGFYVVNNNLDKVIIRGKGLEYIGVELQEIGFDEKEDRKEVVENDAVVLRDTKNDPGELGSLWVLESTVEQIVEGVAINEKIVNIPDEINERLKGERERMKGEYDRRWENNKLYEPLVGDRVYAYKERGEEKNPKLRINRVVDRESPLHWEHVCKECEKNPRKMEILLPECPKDLADFDECKTLKQVAKIRALAEKWKCMTPMRATVILSKEEDDEEELRYVTPRIVEETIGRICVHSRRDIGARWRNWRFTVCDVPARLEAAYRRGLGEDVDQSFGYGVILHRPGIGMPAKGTGDTARWEWKVEELTNWETIITQMEQAPPGRGVWKVLVLWPRDAPIEWMIFMKSTLAKAVERKVWEVIIIREPCGGITSKHYSEFLTEWAGESLERGSIRVIAIEDNAVSDATPVSSLSDRYSWLNRSHWEFMVEAWTNGIPWNIHREKERLKEK